MNALWKFDMNSHTWHYIIGHLGVNEPANFSVPQIGGLTSHSICVDNSSLYVFGGKGFVQDGSGSFNSIWSIDAGYIYSPIYIDGKTTTTVNGIYF